MLGAAMQQQLETYLANLREPIELIASLDESENSRKTRALLEEIAELHEMVSARFDGQATRAPSFLIRRASDHNAAVTFAGLPMGHEFTSLVLALLWAGGHPPKVEQSVLDDIRALDGDYSFDMYFSLSCQNCPDVVQALTLMSVFNPRISATLIEGGAFKDEVENRKVMAVPAIYLDGEPWANGRMTAAEIIAKLDSNSDQKAAARLADKKPYEVLVLGGGPAGVASAIYTARKGFRTGIAAETFGGQVADTMGIENLPGTAYTEGPKLVQQMDGHIGEYDIDVMKTQRADALIPAGAPGGMHEVRLANGASLKARSIVLATGARWRQLGVPGEDEYRNKGVAYCPHCDGPLYKGKRVAVIGGGNSGVEAAIDLANIVGHVTLIEFGAELRADQVLQDKLRSFANVTVLTNAQTTHIKGDGEKVTELVYQNREGHGTHRVELDGVFIQIGLVPNTEWLKDSGIALSQHGEIEIDGHAATNLPGIYAAGDATTVPHKQIVIAMGEGSKAALGAFDYLIRNEAPAEIAQAASA